MKEVIRWAIVLLLAIIFFFIALIGLTTQCHGTEISLGYGQDVSVESWQSEGLKCSVIQVEISESVNSWLYGSLIIAQMHGQLTKAQNIDGQSFDRSTKAMMLTSRLGINKNLADWLSIQGFGGFGLKSGQLPEIGDSGIVGHFGVSVSYVRHKWKIGYEWMHMSDPLQHGDKGWNIQFLTIGRRF